MRGLRRLSRPPRLFGRLAIALVLVMLGLAYGYASRRTETAGRRLVSALLAERFTTGRLSGQTAWHPCVPADTAALVPRMECGPPLDPRSRRTRRINDLARTTRQGAQPDSSPAALRGVALLDLRFADTTTAARERAVAALEQAVRMAPDDAGLLNELSVAQLALGERTQQLTPMLRALNSIERAFAADSQRVEILFNRALIQQRLYLIASADSAWTRYLAVERDPRWRAEAQAHARWVAQVPDTVSWDALLAAPPAGMDSATRAEIAARVERSPQKAREFGFPLLGAWGAAVQAGDSARATRLLSVAREIGAAARAIDVDQSVRLAVDAIDAANDEPRRTRQLAEGHVGLNAGWAFFNQNSHPEALRILDAAEGALRSGGSPATKWAIFYQAAALVNSVDYVRGDSLFSLLVTEAGPVEPALAGKTVLALGVSQLRRGHHDTAIRLYRAAAPGIGKSRESENAGLMDVLLAEGLALAGQSESGSEFAYSALRYLAPFRDSRYLNNHLAIVGSYARQAGLPYAALGISDELVHVARNVNKPSTLTLALFARVRELTAVNRPRAASAALTEAVRWADSLPPGRNSERIRARAKLILGQLTRTRDPGAALPILSEAVRAYNSFGSDFYLPATLYEAALASRSVGDSAQARRWLLQAVEHLERQQSTFESTEARATFYETVENVFDAIIDLELDGEHPEAAFEMLERSRVQVGMRRDWQASPAGAQRPTLSMIASSLPEDMLFVEYALLPDRLVIWTAVRGGTRHHVAYVPRDSVAALVEQFRRGMSDTAPGHARTRLFDLLLRPIAPELRQARRLTIVPDRELSRMPFVALMDRARGRYLVEDYEIRTVPSAGFFTTASGRPAQVSPGAPPLIVGNPRLERGQVSALPSLPGADQEARQVAALYPGSTVLSSTAAQRSRVLDLLPGRSIFHFAGHAVFNVQQPELSYLALAPDSTGHSGILRAQDIGALNLSDVKVVVLSACSSLTPRASRTGAIAGLAYSFLRAGAPATVSTLWDVDDGSTTELLVAFHRRLAAGTPAPEALRRAQLDALRSGTPAMRVPQAWAAFIYTGP
jgi:CHAT domain-containing protein